VRAIIAAFPALAGQGVGVALFVVAALTIANLRGIKEAGTMFAVPTYGFLLSMGATIVVGGVQVATDTYEPYDPPDIRAEASLTLFLVLRAFASGATALTGVEAIANAVPTFRPPESKNAAKTLVVLGLLLGFLFMGITLLGNAYDVDPRLSEAGNNPVPSQIAAAVFGPARILFYAVQVFTALILFLAANTAYAGFPSLASILARDRILPRVLQHRGDKLAYSNGIVVLALAACGLLVVYGANEHRIIPLYVVGVFTDFTLSQAGLVRRWSRLKSPGWWRSAFLNGVGAATALVVLVIVSVTKFTLGAWQVLLLIPALAWVLHGFHRHYERVSRELRIGGPLPKVRANKAVIVVNLPDATVKALAFARAFAPRELHVVAFRTPERGLRELRRRWNDLGIKIPIEATGHHLQDLREYVRSLDPSASEPVMVVVPEPQDPRPLRQMRRSRGLLGIKAAFLTQPGVVVTSVPFRPDLETEPDRLRAPRRFAIIVLVAAVHRATLQAIEYARSLNPAELKAVAIMTEPADAPRIVAEWVQWDIPIPLEVVDSPYRSLIRPLLAQIKEMGPNADDAVAVVIPEFVVSRWWQQLLHNQTALLIKATLLFQPNVIVIDVPYPLPAPARARHRGGANAS
jgi:amino acid transporter